MSDFRLIYQTRAHDYDRLVSREDYQGNILRALREICPPDGLDVVELGAGTGRLTGLLAPFARSIQAFDASPAMLGVAEAKLGPVRPSLRFAVADSRDLPVEDQSADLAIAGWTFGHLTEWHAANWPAEIGRAVAQMLRVLRPGGVAVILETLGTGRETPQPPSEALAAYYAMLARDLGFSSSWIRTDYLFESAAEAAELTSFFFGATVPGRPAGGGRVIVPECTGIFARRKE